MSAATEPGLLHPNWGTTLCSGDLQHWRCVAGGWGGGRWDLAVGAQQGQDGVLVVGEDDVALGVELQDEVEARRLPVWDRWG